VTEDKIMSDPGTLDATSGAPSGALPTHAPKQCGVAAAPCKSCPYRQDVPSGLWAPEEYAKLPRYDGEILDQLRAGAGGLFMCHQKDGCLCAGWLAAHGPHNLLALRMNGAEVADEVWGYASPVPVFSSGAEAAAHGRADIQQPTPKARRAIDRLHRKQLRDYGNAGVGASSGRDPIATPDGATAPGAPQ
jgi:hypothetical protein